MRMQPTEILAAHTGDAVRAAEAPVLARLPFGTLMNRAAAGLSVACVRLLQDRRGGVNGRRVVLLVGSGNNGGDALLAGARLRQRGAQVDALLLGDSAYEPGLKALIAAGGDVVDCRTDAGRERANRALDAADLVVDGIVGLQGAGGLRAPADGLVDAIPPDVPVVAVDLPSGVDPDTGETPGAHVRADVTVTFGAFKPCLFVPPAAHAAGRLVFVDVGIGPEIAGPPLVERLTPLGAARRWPVPPRVAHKYTRGVLGVVAGSDTYPGAAVLACAGAIRAGVGVVRFVGPSGVTGHVLSALPEVVPGVGRVQAWLLGSGVEDDVDQDAAIGVALESGLPCVVDAGALEACVRRRADGSRGAPASAILLTPHAGELARMLEMLGHPVSRADVEARPMHHAVWLAREADATVLLKGPTTLVVSPEGRLRSQDDGPSWMATAGSGDVLAGIAGTLMATGLDAMDAGSMAAMVHGRAGTRASGGGPISAGAIADATPVTVADLLSLLPAAQPSGRRRAPHRR